MSKFYAEDCIATSNDHRIIDAVSYAFGGEAGRRDDVERLVSQVTHGASVSRENLEGAKDPVWVACEIAVAFIRWAQDLKNERNELREMNQLTDTTTDSVE